MRKLLLGLVALLALGRTSPAAPPDKSKDVAACAKALQAPSPSLFAVKAACQPLYTGQCGKAWEIGAAAGDTMRSEMMREGCGEQYCPKLAKETLASCKNGALTRVDASKASSAWRELHARILALELPADAARLTALFDKVWTKLFP